MIVKTAVEEDLKNLYDSDGLTFSNIDFNVIVKDDGEMEDLVSKLKASKITLDVDNSTIFIVSSKLMNSYYDLEGDNACSDNEFFCVLPFDYLDRSDQMQRLDWIHLKESLSVRFWRDVVDNCQYVEYIKGRHAKTSNIQWLIDVNSKDDSTTL